MISVNSSAISKVDHRGKDLYVMFKSGSMYRYQGVPAQMAAELVQAESVGRFFNENIAGQFESDKIEV
jgi:hypothetical protein